MLVERNQLTSGSTFHSAGLVGPAARLGLADQDDDVLGRALPASWARTRGWVECGGIRLASSEERMEELRRQAGWAKTFGLPLELISADEAQELFPLMSTEGVLGAAWLPTDGYLDPSQLTFALAERRPRGRRAPSHTSTRVTGIESEGGRVTRRAHRARRHRGRGRGDRRRHVRRRGRAAGGRAHPGPADVARVHRHPAVPRARSRATRCRRCATPTCSSTSARTAAGS